MWKWSITILSVVGLAFAVAAIAGDLNSNDQRRVAAVKAYQDGNFKEAYVNFRLLALDPNSDPALVPDDLKLGVECLGRLGLHRDIDEFIEMSVAIHSKNWMLLAQAAKAYLHIEHSGYMIAGEFSRGQHRGGGLSVSSAERDRVRALQLMQQGMEFVSGQQSRPKGSFYLDLANAIMNGRGHSGSWRLQTLTDLSFLPDYEELWGAYGQTTGAPVDKDGRPIFYGVPTSLNGAKSDGERWRFALSMATEMDPTLKNDVLWIRYLFASSQFGTDTLDSSILSYQEHAKGREVDAYYALHTLKDEETLAYFANGVKRVTLPVEYNPIKLLKRIIEDPAAGKGLDSLEALVRAYESRRQLRTAAAVLDQTIQIFGPGPEKHRQLKLDQIRNSWARFGPTESQPAGRGAALQIHYRNATSIEFEAHEIKIEQLIGDIKSYIKENRTALDDSRLNISRIGYTLVHDGKTKYLGKKVANWSMDLTPGDQHWDQVATVATPLSKAGAYLIQGVAKDGNTTFVVAWVADTVMVCKSLVGEESMLFVADAIDGRPIP
jgi:hypothetical protein